MSRERHRPNADKPTEPALPAELPDSVETAPDSPQAKRAAQLPAGVLEHHTEAVPSEMLPPRETVTANLREPARAPKLPPRGWKGSFNQCSGCGDFLGAEKRCMNCLPRMMA